MKITKSNNFEKELLDKRRAFKYYYTELIFNKWLGKFKFPELNYQQVNFMMKRFWDTGSVAFCKPIGSKTLEKYNVDLGDGKLILVKYEVSDYYSIYGFPTKATPINIRGVNFIPQTPLEIDKEIVIVYAQENHHSIYESIASKINKIVDLEMILYACNKIQKGSWSIGVDKDDKTESAGILRDLMSDNPFIIAYLDKVKDVKGLVAGAPFVSDKFEQMIQKNLDEIYTFLGFNNVGVLEKKEHLLNEEINANNNVIDSNNDSFLDTIQEGLERVNNVFGVKINIELKNKVLNVGVVKEQEYKEEENND